MVEDRPAAELLAFLQVDEKAGRMMADSDCEDKADDAMVLEQVLVFNICSNFLMSHLILSLTLCSPLSFPSHIACE